VKVGKASTPQWASAGVGDAVADAPAPAPVETKPAGWGPKAARAAPAPAPSMTAAEEAAILGGHNKPGKIVTLFPGTGNGDTTLTIHGINGDPNDTKALATDAAGRGDAVTTFAYDSHFRRLTDSSKDLAKELDTWLTANPDKPLTIDAYSLGGRVAVMSLGMLAKDGKLDGRDVKVNLLAPYVNGNGPADLSWLTPPGIDKLIRNDVPAKDIGTDSHFQHELEKVKLPPTVSVTVFTGGKDVRVPPDDKRLQKVIGNLNAKEVRLPNTTHDSMPDDVAAYLRGPQ
jgi:pimeloyl-ACP methyl ester carboxylesterase